MRKIYFQLVCFLAIAVLIGGCKLDPPVLPADLVKQDASNGSSNTNSSYISYQLNGGQTIKLDKNVFFQVISKSMMPPNGNTQIAANADISSSFSLTGRISSVGMVTADIIMIDNKYIGDGTVTFTEITTDADGVKGTVKGSFTGTVTDPDTQQELPVKGTFNIKQ